MDDRREAGVQRCIPDQAPTGARAPCWSGRWNDRSPLRLGLPGMRSTAKATATCGCGWSRTEFPMCWPSRATRNCGALTEKGPQQALRADRLAAQVEETGSSIPCWYGQEYVDAGAEYYGAARGVASQGSPGLRLGHRGDTCPWGSGAGVTGCWPGAALPSLMSWPTTCASARPVPQWRSW